MSILFRFDNTEVRKRNFFTCVAIPAWSQPGTQSTLWPCILLLNGLNKAEYGAGLINRSYSSITIRAKKQKCKKKRGNIQNLFLAFTIEPKHLLLRQSEHGPDAESLSRLVVGYTKRSSDPQHEKTPERPKEKETLYSTRHNLN